MNPIGKEGAVRLADALRRNRALKMLDLANCHIGDDGAEALGLALRRNTVLEELRLSANGIGSRGAAALAGALRINPAAPHRLNLRLNTLDAHDGESLLSATRHAKGTPEGGPGLEQLQLEHCHVLPGVSELAPPLVNASLLAELQQVLSGEASTQ